MSSEHIDNSVLVDHLFPTAAIAASPTRPLIVCRAYRSPRVCQIRSTCRASRSTR